MRTPRSRLHIESATLTLRDALSALALAIVSEDTDAARTDYESAWENLVGGRAVAVASGRGALAVALRASGIGPGHDVLITGYTCVAVPIAVGMVGASPTYADVDPTSGNMTPETVVAALTPRTRAVVVQHYLGNPAPVEAIRAVVPAGTIIVEDAVHALGSTAAGAMVGRAGDWAVFGTEQSKPISTGQGGVVIANAAWAQRRLVGLDLLRWSRWRTRRWLTRISLDRLTAELSHRLGTAAGETAHRALHRMGLAAVSSSDSLERSGRAPRWREARLPGAMARIGQKQLFRLDGIIEHRRRIAAVYDELIPPEQRLTVAPDASPVWLRYPLRVPDGERLYGMFREASLEPAGRWFATPVYPPHAMERVGYEHGTCPSAETLARQIVNLPTHPLVTPRAAQRLATWVLQRVHV